MDYPVSLFRIQQVDFEILRINWIKRLYVNEASGSRILAAFGLLPAERSGFVVV